MLRIFFCVSLCPPKTQNTRAGQRCRFRPVIYFIKVNIPARFRTRTLSKCNQNTAENTEKSVNHLDFNTQGRARWQDAEGNNHVVGRGAKTESVKKNFWITITVVCIHTQKTSASTYVNFSVWHDDVTSVGGGTLFLDRPFAWEHVSTLSAAHLHENNTNTWGVDVFTGSRCRTGCTVRLLYKYKRLLVQWQRPTVQ